MGFLAPLFWLGLGSTSVYVAPTASSLCATVVAYSAIAGDVYAAFGLSGELDAFSAITGDAYVVSVLSGEPDAFSALDGNLDVVTC